MKSGTIVLTPFPFTDLTSIKRRPAVVVSVKNEGDDVIVAFVSSKVYEPLNDTDFLIKTDHPDFQKTGLKVHSIVKASKLVTLEKSILICELGSCSEAIMTEIEKRLKITFGL